MRTLVLAQIPDTHVAATITTDELALVRMDDNIINREATGVRVVALHRGRTRVPDLDRAVLGARDEPLALAVPAHARHVGIVPLELEHRVRVRVLDVVQLHRQSTGRGQKALVWRDAQPVHLRVRVLNRARADPRERFPEPGVEWGFSGGGEVGRGMVR